MNHDIGKERRVFMDSSNGIIGGTGGIFRLFMHHLGGGISNSSAL